MTRPLRIAHIQPIALDIFGHRDEGWGTEVQYFLTNITGAQVRQQDQPTVHLLTSSKAKQLDVNGVRVRFHACAQLPRSLPVTVRFGRQLSLSMLGAIRREEIDVIHFHGARSLHLMYGAVAWRARRQRIPLLAQDHGSRSGRWCEEILLHYGQRRTATLFAANAASRQQLEAAGFSPELLQIVPNGIDPAVFHAGEARRRGPHEALRILVVSRLWEDKDPMTMAEGVCRFVDSGHETHVTVIGEGVMRAQVEERLRQTGITATFLEHVPQRKLAEYYRRSDVLVLTSLREGWNQATMEAMACGLPVVATDIPGVRDGVGDAGILLPTGRPDLLSEALKRLALHPELGLTLRSRGLVRSQRFTWDAVVTNFRKAYETQMAAADIRRSFPNFKEAEGPAKPKPPTCGVR